MGRRWNSHGMLQLACITLFIIFLGIQGHPFLNSEGHALLSFRDRVTFDSSGTLENWNPHESDHCTWSGIQCVDHKVQILDLNGCSLEGTLAPELGNLTYLRILILSNNHFSGVIPKQFGQLALLEVLDLRDNDLYGTIPVEIGALLSLKQLLLCNNNFEGGIHLEIGNLDLLIKLQFDVNLTPPFAEVTRLNKKIVQCEWQSTINLLRKRDSILSPVKGTRINHYFSMFPRKEWTDNIDSDNSVSSLSKFIQRVHDVIKISRRKLGEQSSNLQAIPTNGGAPLNHAYHPNNRSSGSFSVVPIIKHVFSPPPPHTTTSVPVQPPPHTTSSNPYGQIYPKSQNKKPATGNSGHLWKYIVGISMGIFLIIFAILLLFICRSKASKTIVGPWKSGLSGQLQNAFVKGVPKLNRVELEAACEDFSNIIEMNDEVIVYKGTLSSGTEIAVVSTTITSIEDWSNRSEMIFRKKINTMSRVNHKNFVNLIGYCEEEAPFSRMMVFEYAPNGALYEHLHAKEVEHLDWSARMRILMGTAYCLQHMHNLKPPIAHSNVNSKVISLTDDYAAKLVEICFWTDFQSKSEISKDINDAEYCELPPPEDLETNVYDFGILLLELISGKPPYSKEPVSIVTWASEYLNDEQSINYLIDPSLKSFKENELAIICEVIQECIQPNARKRPTMEEITSKLRVVLDISSEFATARLSPLWWAELEILSAEVA